MKKLALILAIALVASLFTCFTVSAAEESVYRISISSSGGRGASGVPGSS